MNGPVRTDLLDTSPAIHKAKLELLRKMTPEQRVLSLFEQMRFLREWRKATESLRHGL